MTKEPFTLSDQKVYDYAQCRKRLDEWIKIADDLKAENGRKDQRIATLEQAIEDHENWLKGQRELSNKIIKEGYTDEEPVNFVDAWDTKECHIGYQEAINCALNNIERLKKALAGKEGE